jgi:hypothetical protein
MLKGDKPPRWIVEGLPSVKKGKDWALELVDEQPANPKSPAATKPASVETTSVPGKN